MIALVTIGSPNLRREATDSRPGSFSRHELAQPRPTRRRRVGQGIGRRDRRRAAPRSTAAPSAALPSVAMPIVALKRCGLLLRLGRLRDDALRKIEPSPVGREHREDLGGGLPRASRSGPARSGLRFLLRGLRGHIRGDLQRRCLGGEDGAGQGAARKTTAVCGARPSDRRSRGRARRPGLRGCRRRPGSRPARRRGRAPRPWAASTSRRPTPRRRQLRPHAEVGDLGALGLFEDRRRPIDAHDAEPLRRPADVEARRSRRRDRDAARAAARAARPRPPVRGACGRADRGRRDVR